MAVAVPARSDSDRAARRRLPLDPDGPSRPREVADRRAA
jgi:hypothetical protein